MTFKMDGRIQQLTAWLAALFDAGIELTAASNDASFRRYFRVRTGAETYIAVDVPPDKENSAPFIQVAARLLDAGLNVPRILHQNHNSGFLLVTDLGDRTYLQSLDSGNADTLYTDAIMALLQMQRRASRRGLPAYDHALLAQELALFRDWTLERHLQVRLTFELKAMFERCEKLLVESALTQPVTFVHRDFHSRNLMFCPAHNPGILDFQDAVIGPVTYDLVSLVKDCYVKWPQPKIAAWTADYYRRATRMGILRKVAADDFLLWFELMGVQRHLKAAGIFARLFHRDGKADYLKDVPRTLSYVVDVCEKYPELPPLHELGCFIRARVLDAL